MNSRSLTPGQVAHLKRRVDADLAYYSKLELRMSQTGFPHLDPAFIAAAKARAALYDLHLALGVDVEPVGKAWRSIGPAEG
jgi:hypothetical protein